MEHLKAFINSVTPISSADFDLLKPIMTAVKVKKGTNLLHQGKVCKQLYFLEKGFFRMFYVDGEGNEINCRFTGEHHFMVDFQSFLMQTPSNYFWQAMQDSELLSFSYSDVEQLYASSNTWQHFGRKMAEFVYVQLNERVEMFQFFSPEQRYQLLLDNHPELFNQVSQFHLSSYLGIKPESLSRLRKRLHDR